jgi:hypothetical protein
VGKVFLKMHVVWGLLIKKLINEKKNEKIIWFWVKIINNKSMIWQTVQPYPENLHITPMYDEKITETI